MGERIHAPGHGPFRVSRSGYALHFGLQAAKWGTGSYPRFGEGGGKQQAATAQWIRVAHPTRRQSHAIGTPSAIGTLKGQICDM